MQRREVQIANLQFKIEHAEELGLKPRKMQRMTDALSSLHHAQEAYGERLAKHVNNY